jgi:tetratricopeptide (TPR) repeat protein
MVGALLFSALLLSPGLSQQRSVTTADQQLAQLHYRSGWQALKAESFDEAAREFQAAIDVIPGFTLAYYGLGRADMGGRHFVEAVAAYERCKALYLEAAGRKFSGQIDANRAREDQQMELREAIRQTSQGPQTQRSQEMIRQFQSQLRLVRQDQDRGMNVSIDSSVPAFVSLALGSAYFRTSRFDDAEREYKAAVAADPKLGEAWNNLGVVYATTSRYAEAERALEAAEKVGYAVNPQLKEDIKRQKKGVFESGGV